jgi:putative ABC transport system ATP-binding protein
VESERLHVFSVIVPRHPALASRSRRGGLVETELRPRVSHLVPVLAAVSTERISAQQERLQSSSSSPFSRCSRVTSQRLRTAVPAPGSPGIRCGLPSETGRPPPWSRRPSASTLDAMDSVIELERVSRHYRHEDEVIVALDRVSLDVASGSYVAVMGATGSGKSTLLHCAAGLEHTTTGTVRLVGTDLRRLTEGARTRLRRDRVGFVFQSYNLLSELTVEQNVMLPRRLGARGGRTVRDVLDAVGLSGTERRPVGELSGGQRQRVAIARALGTAPAVIFADEPTGSLDPTTGSQILSLLRRSVDTQGVTVVMVTHDPLAAAVSDRLILLRAGQIVQDGPTPDAASIATDLRAVSTPASLELVR